MSHTDISSHVFSHYKMVFTFGKFQIAIMDFVSDC